MSLRKAVIRLAFEKPELRAKLLPLVEGHDKTAAANTITIVKDFQKHWKDIKAAIDKGDFQGARRLADIILSAYYYAPGMNESVIALSDTGDVYALKVLVDVLGKKDDEEIRKHAPRQVQRVEKDLVSTWPKILQKYRWQQGMRAEEIQRRFRRVNDAFEELGSRGGSAVMKAFFEKGPKGAEAKYDQLLRRRKGIPARTARLLPPEGVVGAAMRKTRFRDRDDAKGAVELAFKEYANEQMKDLQRLFRRNLSYWTKEVETAWETQRMYPR